MAFHQAEDLLHRHRIEKLLVVNEAQELRGLITIKDIEKIQRHPNAARGRAGAHRSRSSSPPQCSLRRRRVKKLVPPYHIPGAVGLREALARGARQAHHEAAPAPVQRRPLRVLVAEDNAINRKVVCMLLDRWGHQARAVRDGVEAVEAFEGRLTALSTTIRAGIRGILGVAASSIGGADTGADL